MADRVEQGAPWFKLTTKGDILGRKHVQLKEIWQGTNAIERCSNSEVITHAIVEYPARLLSELRNQWLPIHIKIPNGPCANIRY